MTLNKITPFRLSFIGPAGSGKTTLARMMSTRHGAIQLSFAEALRAEVAGALYPNNTDQMIECFNNMSNIDKKQPYRSILQAWGVLRRELDGVDYWLHAVEDLIDFREKSYPESSFVIDDCRFDNEYKMLQKLGFVFIRCAPNPTGTTALLPDQQAHVSERFHKLMETELDLHWHEGPTLRTNDVETFLQYRSTI